MLKWAPIASGCCATSWSLLLTNEAPLPTALIFHLLQIIHHTKEQDGNSMPQQLEVSIEQHVVHYLETVVNASSSRQYSMVVCLQSLQI